MKSFRESIATALLGQLKNRYSDVKMIFLTRKNTTKAMSDFMKKNKFREALWLEDTDKSLTLVEFLTYFIPNKN